MGLIGSEQLGSLVEAIKNKVRSLRKARGRHKNGNKYAKMDKSSSIKVEIKSRKARQLIERTLKAADQPGGTFLTS